MDSSTPKVIHLTTEPLRSVLSAPPLTLALVGIEVIKLAWMSEPVTTYGGLALTSRGKEASQTVDKPKKKLNKVTN